MAPPSLVAVDQELCDATLAGINACLHFFEFGKDVESAPCPPPDGVHASMEEGLSEAPLRDEQQVPESVEFETPDQQELESFEFEATLRDDQKESGTMDYQQEHGQHELEPVDEEKEPDEEEPKPVDDHQEQEFVDDHDGQGEIVDDDDPTHSPTHAEHATERKQGLLGDDERAQEDLNTAAQAQPVTTNTREMNLGLKAVPKPSAKKRPGAKQQRTQQKSKAPRPAATAKSSPKSKAAPTKRSKKAMDTQADQTQPDPETKKKLHCVTVQQPSCDKG